MSGLPLFDAAGRRRSPATMPGYHAGREPRNRGRTYPADPPTVEEIVSVMRQTGAHRERGCRQRADRRAVAGRSRDPGSALAGRD
jgi:hypothetical protein